MELVNKVGRWDIAGLMVRNLKSDITKELTIVLKQIGSQGEKRIKKYIRDQEGKAASGELKWEDLSKAYIAYKKRKGLSSKTLISSSSMWQSITSVAVYPKVYVGIKRGAKNKDGEDLVNIGAVMEFGSKKRDIPARPFVRPVANELIEDVTKNNLIGRRLLALLRKKYNF